MPKLVRSVVTRALIYSRRAEATRQEYHWAVLGQVSGDSVFATLSQMQMTTKAPQVLIVGFQSNFNK